MQNNPRFPILSKLICAILTIPHTTADVERIFSELGDFYIFSGRIKTKDRNSLDNESLNGLVGLKQIKRFEGREALENMAKRFKNKH